MTALQALLYDLPHQPAPRQCWLDDRRRVAYIVPLWYRVYLHEPGRGRVIRCVDFHERTHDELVLEVARWLEIGELV